MTSAIARIDGPATVLHGDDIDTDRIMPARFLRAITFEGLEAHLFEDDRRETTARGGVHPFDDPARRGARVLIAGRNFGCGSSREHAPQALRRWGLRAVVAESFAEIFFGNALMIGLPCVTAAAADLAALRERVERDPNATLAIDLESRRLSATDSGGGSPIVAEIAMPESARAALLSGEWDATSLLLANYEDVLRVEARLGY